MSIPECMLGVAWAQRTARAVLPLLVARAQQGRPITYGQLDAEVVRRGWGHHVLLLNYGRAVGAIGDALIETSKDWGVEIPPLNALVVNAKTGMPGDGCDYYVERFVAKAYRREAYRPEDLRAFVEETHAAISSFTRWEELLTLYGLVPLDLDQDDLQDGPNDGGDFGDCGSGGESPAHLKLKEWVACNPCAIGLPADARPSVEHEFPSGDRVDVLFRLGFRAWAVEVKTAEAPDLELQRGVYQSVKYQALLRAVQKVHCAPPVGQALLVCGGPASEVVQQVADLLGIRVVASVGTPSMDA